MASKNVLHPRLLDLPPELLQLILNHVVTPLLSPSNFWQIRPYPPYIPVSALQKYSYKIFWDQLYHREIPSTFDSSSPQSLPVQKQCSLRSLLLTCRTLHNATQALLRDQYARIVTVDTTDQAPTGANSFSDLDALSPLTRNTISTVCIRIAVSTEPFRLGFSGSSKDFHKDLRNHQIAQNFLLERFIENLVEIIELLPGLRRMHIVWAAFCGNSGYQGRYREYLQRVFRRMRSEVEGRRREVVFDAQAGMGWIYDEGGRMREEEKWEVNECWMREQCFETVYP